MLQTYFYLTDFKEQIFKQLNDSPFIKALQRLFAFMTMSVRKYVDPSPLMKFINIGMKIGTQQDIGGKIFIFLLNI